MMDSQKQKYKYDLLWPLGGGLLLLFLLELACPFFAWPVYILPPPSLWWQALLEFKVELQSALLSTAANTALGFLISVVIGQSIALLLATSRVLRKLFLPLFIVFQTVPVVAIAPLLVIWFGFGAPTVIAASSIVSVFPILANSLAGLSQTSDEWLELFQSLRASRWQTLCRLKIPAALPAVFMGLRVGLGLALVGCVVGEFIAGSGLGALIDSARTQQRTDLVFATLSILTLLGLVFVGVLDFLWALIKKWRPFTPKDGL
jgi:NitT/TauT family transport system permease protein